MLYSLKEKIAEQETERAEKAQKESKATNTEKVESKNTNKK